jgi:hypothetical protein
MSGNGITDGLVVNAYGDENGYNVEITAGNVVATDTYTGAGLYYPELLITGSVFSNSGFRTPGGLTIQNQNGSQIQYGGVSIGIDTATYPSDIASGYSINGDVDESSISYFVNTYTNEYSGKAVPVITGGGYYTGLVGSSNTNIGFYSSSIDIWKPTNFKAKIAVTGSVSASGYRITGTPAIGLQYNQPSTGSTLGTNATYYGRGDFKIYQYGGQSYAFNAYLQTNVLAAYTGSEFQWGLETNGTNSIPGGGSTYFSLVSGSTINGTGPGATKVGLPYLQTAQYLDFRADSAFNRKVYINNGLMVSASNGSNTASVIINASVGGGQKALEVTGSVTITGSLSVNGTNVIASLAAGAFYSSVTQSGSANVSQSMTFNNTDINESVSVNSGTQLTVANGGTYNIQFSAQIDRVSGSGTDTVHIWLKKNGSVVSNSAGAITVSGGASAAKTISSWNYVVNANAGDYFELVWQPTDANLQLIAAAATGNIPAIPSVIATVTQVN